MPARYKATFRSLLTEVKWLVKEAEKKNGDDWKVLAHNITTIVVWRIMDRDKKTRDLVRRLKRAINDLT